MGFSRRARALPRAEYADPSPQQFLRIISRTNRRAALDNRNDAGSACPSSGNDGVPRGRRRCQHGSAVLRGCSKIGDTLCRPRSWTATPATICVWGAPMACSRCGPTASRAREMPPDRRYSVAMLNAGTSSRAWVTKASTPTPTPFPGHSVATPIGILADSRGVFFANLGGAASRGLGCEVGTTTPWSPSPFATRTPESSFDGERRWLPGSRTLRASYSIGLGTFRSASLTLSTVVAPDALQQGLGRISLRQQRGAVARGASSASGLDMTFKDA